MNQIYELWRTHPYFDEATRGELNAIAHDPAEIEERFYRELAFGTGGLRGVIGAGTNRINRYVVRKATWGLASYMASFGPYAMRRGVAIAYDSRRFSPEFAQEAALTLAANGVRAHLFSQVTPTPLLSFAVRELGAIAGIVITASHNPAKYNGFKVYWEDGGQVPPERAAAIYEQIQALTDITAVVPMDRESALAADLLHLLDDRLEHAYVARVAGLALRPDVIAEQGDSFKLLYTPLHGAGLRPVVKTLKAMGFASVSVVPEQAEPDGEFPTVASPNPEEPAAFERALALARKLQPDIILATDPDADRVGVAVPDPSGAYTPLNGNQIGALLADYMLQQRQAAGTLPSNGVIIKTIATSNLVKVLAAPYGVAVEDTLTGFKFIGERIAEYEQTGQRTFLLGFEESYGYLVGTFVRDKDAVMASVLVAEVAAFHKSQGRTLPDALDVIYKRCGYYLEVLHSITLEGKSGQEMIGRIMQVLRAESDPAWLGTPVTRVDDYLARTGWNVATGERYGLTLPTSDVLHYHLPGEGFVLVRPSGTEPKMKLYLSVVGESRAAAEAELVRLRERVQSKVAEIMG